MLPLVFPVLQLSRDWISILHDEDTFRRAVSLTTDKAIREGFFEEVRLFDANLVEHRVERLELAGKAGLFGWMKRGREIKVLALASKGEVAFVDVKSLVAVAPSGPECAA